MSFVTIKTCPLDPKVLLRDSINCLVDNRAFFSQNTLSYSTQFFTSKTGRKKKQKSHVFTARPWTRLLACVKNRACYHHATTRGDVMWCTRKFGDFRQVSAVLRFSVNVFGIWPSNRFLFRPFKPSQGRQLKLLPKTHRSLIDFSFFSVSHLRNYLLNFSTAALLVQRRISLPLSKCLM